MLGRRRGDRHARGRLRRAARPRRPVRARRPQPGVPPPRGSARPRAGRRRRAGLPLWPSDRQSLSAELAGELAEFRAEGARRLARGRAARAPRLADRKSLDARSPGPPRSWPSCSRPRSGSARCRAVDELLVEEVSRRPDEPGLAYTFHAPLNRAACEALGRAIGGPAGPAVRPRPGAPGRRPGLVDPPAREGAELDRTWSRLAARSRAARPTTCSKGSTGATARAAVPARRGDGLDGPAQPRAGRRGAGRRPELGQHPALPAGEGGLPRPPPAPRDPPRGACTTARRARGGALARLAAGSPVPRAGPVSPVRRGLDHPRATRSRSSSSRPPTPSAGSTLDSPHRGRGKDRGKGKGKWRATVTARTKVRRLVISGFVSVHEDG